MDLKLNPATKKAFLDIDSVDGFTDVIHLFNKFMESSGPLTMKDFAELMGKEGHEALKFAQNKGEINTKGELVGLLGLSIVPTNHELTMAGRKFYTWCAADSLIFPAILGEDAVIHSKDPMTGESIEIRVKNDRLLDISPKEAMISWVDEINEDDIRCSMCNRVHFFTTAATAANWHENNKDARIFKVEDYYASGISTNG